MRARVIFWTVGLLVCLGFVALLVLGTIWRKDSNWWAAWGQWIGGVGSIAAAAAALWIAVESWRKSDAESGLRRERDERELASQFGVWIDKNVHQMPDGKYRTRQIQVPDWFSVQVSNSTPQPMYNVSVIVEFAESTMRFSHRKPIVGPTSSPVHFEAERGTFQHRLDRAVEHLRTSRQGNTHGEAANALADTNKDLDYWHVIDRASIKVEFTDGDNVRWRREVPGELRKA